MGQMGQDCEKSPKFREKYGFFLLGHDLGQILD